MYEREDQQREVSTTDRLALELLAKMCNGMTENQKAYFRGWMACAMEMAKVSDGKKAS